MLLVLAKKMLKNLRLQMDKLRFGTAGIPITTEDRNTLNGVKQVRNLGLDAM